MKFHVRRRSERNIARQRERPLKMSPFNWASMQEGFMVGGGREVESRGGLAVLINEHNNSFFATLLTTLRELFSCGEN